MLATKSMLKFLGLDGHTQAIVLNSIFGLIESIREEDYGLVTSGDEAMSHYQKLKSTILVSHDAHTD